MPSHKSLYCSRPQVKLSAKRQRGRKLVASLTLRVSVDRAISNREQYKQKGLVIVPPIRAACPLGYGVVGGTERGSWCGKTEAAA